MARRSKRKSAPRRTNNLSLTGVAQSYIVGSAMTRAAFGMGLAPFLSEGWLTPSTKTQATAIGMGSGWVQGVSLAELVQEIVPGGKDGGFGSKFSLGQAVKANMKQYGPQAVVTAIATPVAFRVARRLMSRSGVTRYANKGFKMAGLPVRV